MPHELLFAFGTYGDELFCLGAEPARTFRVRPLVFVFPQHTPVVPSSARRDQTLLLFLFLFLSVNLLMGDHPLALPCLCEGGRTGPSSIPGCTTFLERAPTVLWRYTSSPGA